LQDDAKVMRARLHHWSLTTGFLPGENAILKRRDGATLQFGSALLAIL
jgi:hypothetical protein